MMAPEMLDCGHESAPQDWGNGSGLPGYAVTRDSRKICYDCAHKMELEELKTRDRMFAYLSSDGRQLTVWTGQKLADVTYLNKGQHNIGGHLYRFRAIDVHGQRWYGTSPGEGMYARMRKAKR